MLSALSPARRTLLSRAAKVVWAWERGAVVDAQDSLMASPTFSVTRRAFPNFSFAIYLEITLGGLEVGTKAEIGLEPRNSRPLQRILPAVARWLSLPLAPALFFVVVVAFLDRAVTRAQEDATGVWHAGSTPSGLTWPQCSRSRVPRTEGA